MKLALAQSPRMAEDRKLVGRQSLTRTRRNLTSCKSKNDTKARTDCTTSLVKCPTILLLDARPRILQVLVGRNI